LAAKVYERDGSFPWFIGRNTEYQTIAVTVINGNMTSEVLDRAANRVIHVAPIDKNRPIILKQTVKLTPSDCTGLTCLDEVAYSVPDEFKPYTGITKVTFPPNPNPNVIDPTTTAVKKMAASLRGRSLYETVENDLRFASVDISPPKGELPIEADGSEACLRLRTGACMATAQLLCALLRAQGFAARVSSGVVGFHAFADTKQGGPLGHSWAQLWVPKLRRWVPIAPGARSGSYLHDWLEVWVEQLDNSLWKEVLPTANDAKLPPEIHLLAGCAGWCYDFRKMISNRCTRISSADYAFDPKTIPPTASEDAAATDAGHAGSTLGLLPLSDGLPGWVLKRGVKPQVATTPEGERYLSTEGADSLCEVVSPAFALTGDKLRLTIAGCSRKLITGIPETYVGLEVDGEIVLRACGEDDAALREVLWYVAQWKGKQARLVVVDRSRGGRAPFVMVGEVTGA
jgi:hypothetical protein